MKSKQTFTAAALLLLAFSSSAHAADCTTLAAELAQSPVAQLAGKMSATPAECRYAAFKQAGEQCHTLKQYDPAQTLFEGALKAAPCEAETYLWVGGIYEMRKQYELAACHYQKGLALAQDNENLKSDFQTAYAEVSARLPAMPTKQLSCSVELGRLIAASNCMGKFSLNRGMGDATARNLVVATSSGSADMRIHFDYDKAEITSQGMASLHQLSNSMKNDMGSLSRDLIAEEDTPETKKITVTLIGHADERGQENYNNDLSIRRAEAVKKMLARDFPHALFQVEGKGKSEPVMRGATTEEQHALNRRVEIRIY